MMLPRTTVCTLFSIKAPIWNGGKKKVGLRADRIGEHNEIEFTYRRKSDGELSIPDHYYISRKKIESLDFERQNTKGVTLIIVPFDQLEILSRVERKARNDEEEFIQWLNDPKYAKSKDQLNSRMG